MNIDSITIEEWRKSFKKPSKYKNMRTYVDGAAFDSKKEAKRFSELRLLERAGKIKTLRLQPEFDIIINKVKVCRYIADFQYEEGGKIVVEDVKAEITKKIPVYRLKKLLMLAMYGIKIKET